jgi:integrase/recombinase XerD
MKLTSPTLLAQVIQDFFGNYLVRLRGMSPHTIASYRDSLVLLLRFIATRKKIPIQRFDLSDIDTTQILAFLAYLEDERHNGVTTRNARLAAIHAFFRYLAGRNPERLEYCQRILCIPFKRTRTPTIDYLEYEEIQKLLSCVDQSTLDGERDYVLLASLFNTGARVQEILNLRVRDIQFTKPYQLRLFGKGRKERFCPLWPQTVRILRLLCKRRKIDLASDQRMFVNHRGQPLTRFGVRYLLNKYLDKAKAIIPELCHKRLHPHSIRHSTAIALLKSGVDLTTISQWLGHSSPTTTNRYATIDLDIKRKALARVAPLNGQRSAAWHKNDSILDWLDTL